MIYFGKFLLFFVKKILNNFNKKKMCCKIYNLYSKFRMLGESIRGKIVFIIFRKEIFVNVVN